jgi:hypothetical protein
MILASDLKTIHGLDYVGKCYDALKMDPLNIGGSSQGLNAIDCTAEAVDTYKVGNYSIPLGMTLVSPFATDSKSFRSLIYNSYDFQEEFSGSIEVDAGIKGLFDFSASTSYKEMTKETQSRKHVFSYAIVHVQNHTLTLSLEDLDNDQDLSAYITAAFKNAVKNLPSDTTTQDNQRAYAKFVERFGTHFLSKVSLGGMAYSRVKGLTEKVSRTRSTENEFKVRAGIEIEAFSSGTTAKESRSRADTVDRENEYERTTLVFRGGVGETHEIASTWFTSLEEKPAPIPVGTSLAPLASLLTARLFKDDAAIALKQSALDRFVKDYIVLNGGNLGGYVSYQTKRSLFTTENWQLYFAPDWQPPSGPKVPLPRLYPQNPARHPGENYVPATLTVLDPKDKLNSLDVLLSQKDTLVHLRIEQAGGKYLMASPGTRDPKLPNGSGIGFTADRGDPRSQWNVRRWMGGDMTGTAQGRPLVSQDQVLISRYDAATKSFQALVRSTPESGMPAGLALWSSPEDPYFKATPTERRRATFVIG